MLACGAAPASDGQRSPVPGGDNPAGTPPAPSADAAAPTIEVTRLSDHLLFFFDGRDLPDSGTPAAEDWVADAAMKLGVGTYAIHRGDQALVYDTFTSVAQARWVRRYLEELGIKHFTVVLSHWHLDHIAGNEVYADSEIVSSALTRKVLQEKKAAIEAGTEWGPPAIKPVVLPTATFEGQTILQVGDIAVQLRNVDIHSKDTTILYLPGERIALVGDTLEDPLTYMVEIEELPNHVTGLRAMRAMDIAAIFPNHGDPAVIKRGGYDKTLIDATIDYITRMLSRAHEPSYLDGTMEEYIGDSLAKGWVHAFEAYRAVHKHNLEEVAKYYKDKPLPKIPAR